MDKSRLYLAQAQLWICHKAILWPSYSRVQKALLSAVQNHFNFHYCYGEWLIHRNKTSEECKKLLKYCSVTEHVKMYQEALQIHYTYFIDECIMNLWHDFDSQRNEVLNKCIAKYAPKFKEYSMTMSLIYQVSIAIGITSVSYLLFWTTVFQFLQIEMTPLI